MTGLWEVFRQERKGQPFQHAGSFAAPDRAFAETYAREQVAWVERVVLAEAA